MAGAVTGAAEAATESGPPDTPGTCRPGPPGAERVGARPGAVRGPGTADGAGPGRGRPHPAAGVARRAVVPHGFPIGPPRPAGLRAAHPGQRCAAARTSSPVRDRRRWKVTRRGTVTRGSGPAITSVGRRGGRPVSRHGGGAGRPRRRSAPAMPAQGDRVHRRSRRLLRSHGAAPPSSGARRRPPCLPRRAVHLLMGAIPPPHRALGHLGGALWRGWSRSLSLSVKNPASGPAGDAGRCDGAGQDPGRCWSSTRRRVRVGDTPNCRV